jgi:transposase
MEIVYERCAGLDVQKKNVKACFSSPGAEGHRTKETRTYLTMTQNLSEMRDWLKEQGCTHIALQATGVYWKPIYNLLEGDFEILVVNAHHIKTVPGRKTERAGRRMDCRSAGPWTARGQFHPIGSAARIARADTLPHQPGRGARA